MSCSISRPLFLHKILFFTFYGALGSIMAFLTIHMRELGLDIEEITWINSVLPLTSLLGPPLVGLLADRLGNYRLITIVFMVFSGVMHTSMLFVPPYSTSPRLSVSCNSFGASLVLDTCGHTCPAVPRNGSTALSFRVWGCQKVCEGGNTTDAATVHYQPPSGPPQDLTFTHDQVSLSLESDIPEGRRLGEGQGTKCYYPLGGAGRDDLTSPALTCNASPPQCSVVCNVTEASGARVLHVPLCVRSSGNPSLTFWLYFGLRAMADMSSAILVSLLEAVALTMVHQHNGDYGREKMCGLLAVGIFSPLSGYLMDTHIGTFGVYNYAPVFYVFDSLLIITATVTLFLPFEVEVTRKSLWKSIGSLLKTSELNVLLLLMTLLGTFWGYLKTFVYVYLEDLHASKLLMGLTVTVSIFPSLPFLYKSSSVVKFCGHHYLMMLAFVGYCVRFAGFSYIANPNWALMLESLELFTLNLMNVSAATLAYKLAPKTFVATAQALVWVSHFNIGRCLGIFVGGYLITRFGQVRVFQGASVVAAVVAALYLALHQLVKRIRSSPKPPPVRENGNMPNGHYAPLQASEGC